MAVDYHDAFGFPERATVDPSLMMADEEFEFSVWNLVETTP